MRRDDGDSSLWYISTGSLAERQSLTLSRQHPDIDTTRSPMKNVIPRDVSS